eukprot:352473-Chlamydomonas_euryale.AAC.21
MTAQKVEWVARVQTRWKEMTDVEHWRADRLGSRCPACCVPVCKHWGWRTPLPGPRRHTSSHAQMHSHAQPAAPVRGMLSRDGGGQMFWAGRSICFVFGLARGRGQDRFRSIAWLD